MADINHQISLGIGTPAGIMEFLTLGLQFPLVGPDVFPNAVTTTKLGVSKVTATRTGLSNVTVSRSGLSSASVTRRTN